LVPVKKQKLGTVTATLQGDPHATAAFTDLANLTNLAFVWAGCYYHLIANVKRSAAGDTHPKTPDKMT
jgi:hypothetical protein